MRRLLVHPIDALPALVVTAGVALAFVPFVVPLPAVTLAALAVVSVAARTIAPVHQHCHAHMRVFRVAILNHAYDLVLMLAAGQTTAVWQLQHVLGHHRSLLDRDNDPANSRRFTKDGPFQRIIFTIAGDALSFIDSLRVARHQRTGRRLLRGLWTAQLVQLATMALLFAWHPKLALVFFIAPNVVLRWFVFWFSYTQHHGLEPTSVYDGAYTHFDWTNAVFLNVGHHTAHHEKPTLHWSKLPTRTAQILDRIPEACLR